MSPWNDNTDRQLLLTIIHLQQASAPKWDQVASLMGEGFTAESTRFVTELHSKCSTADKTLVNTSKRCVRRVRYVRVSALAVGGAQQLCMRLLTTAQKQFGKPGTPSGSPAPKTTTPRKSGGGKRKKAQAELDDEEASPTKTTKKEEEGNL